MGDGARRPRGTLRGALLSLEGMTLTETTEMTAPAEMAAETQTALEPHQHTYAHPASAPSMNPELRREISVEADAEQVSSSFRKVIKRYQKLARIPGFRAGKVPESVVRSKFSKEVRQEVLEGLVTTRFRQTLDEQKLLPVSEPQVTNLLLQDGQPLRFTATFEVRPEFEVSDYGDITVKRPDVALTEAEYTAELDRVLEGYATVETVEEDRPLVQGDWAEIEFKGEMKSTSPTEIDAAASKEDQAEPILGEDVLIEVGGANTLPAFNEALMGAKPGQELRFEVDYPAEFGEPRLAGKTVAYDVTVKAIKRKLLPERDAELAKQLGPYESFADFEAQLREMASGRKKEALEGRAKDELLAQLVARYQFPVPEAFVQQQIEARLDRGLRALAQQGMQAEDMRKLDFARLRDAQRDQAVDEVKASMILDKLAETEHVEISDEEFDRELLMLSLQSREPLETLRERLAKDGSLERIREQMRRERTGSVLYEKLAPQS